MAREVDEKKTRKALRKLRRAATRVEETGGPGLTDWEKQFVEGVAERLEKYGSAFKDPGKGSLDEALSARQTHIVRALDKKGRKAKTLTESAGAPPGPEPGSEASPGRAPARHAPRSTFRRKAPQNASRSRDIHADIETPPAEPAPASQPVSAGERRAALRVIRGGKTP